MPPPLRASRNASRTPPAPRSRPAPTRRPAPLREALRDPHSPAAPPSVDLDDWQRTMDRTSQEVPG